MSVKVPRCRFCRRATGCLVADPALGAARRRDRLNVRQTWHHVSCLYAASGVTEMPYPGQGELESARQRRKQAAIG